MTHTLKINGKEYPFKLGIRGLMEYGQTFQGSKDKLDPSQLTGFDAQVNLITIGLKHGAKKEGVDFTLTPDDVEELFDTDMDAFMEAIEVVNASMLQGKERRGAAK